MKQWDKIFRKYGKFHLKPQENIPKIAKLFKKKGIKKILDLGSGGGRHVVYLTECGFEVYGIDAAPEGIKITKDCLKKGKLKAKLKVGNIYKRLPYLNDFFDALISTQTLHHNKIREIKKLIKEMERILKSKGLIFITVSRREPLKNIQKDKLWKIKFIAPRTYIPLSHQEKGLTHYWFTKKLLRKEFKNFKIYDLWVQSDGKHYCLLGELKKREIERRRKE